MNILSFNKITKPIYEGGLTLDSRPQGRFLVEVRRTDGTIRRPFGDHLIDNTFLDVWRDYHIGYTTINDGWGNGASANANTWLDFFYGAKSSIAVGSGSAPASAADTVLGNPIRHDSTPYASGNAATWNQSTGDVVYTIKEEFPAETGTVTYREAGIRLTAISGTTGSINGLARNTSENALMNRVVFPSNVTLDSGEVLILTIAVTIPTLASTSGKTVTIGSQNGVNISGVMKMCMPQNDLIGGTVTGGGVMTRVASPTNNAQPATLSVFCKLNNSTTAGTLGSNLSGGTSSVEVSRVLGSWSPGQTYRDFGFTFGSNIPTTNFTFRQLQFRVTATSASTQLLLDNNMIKASAGVLAFSLRYSV